MKRNNKQDITKLLAPYMLAFPSSKADQGTLIVYANVLAGFNLSEIEAALNKLLLTAKFFPSVAEIVEEIEAVKNYAREKQSGRHILTDAEAWENVMQAVKSHGPYSSEKLEFANEDVAAAARQFGIMELYTLAMDDVNTARAQFMRMYNRRVQTRRENQKNEMALSALGAQKVRALIARTADMKEIKA